MITEKRVHEIVNRKLSMHIRYPAPTGHKGLGKLMRRAKLARGLKARKK